MNCDEARRHWHLYYDSEGDAELYFQINEHLDQCPACAEWFHHESRLEDALVDKLRSAAPAGPTPELWKSVLARSGIQQPVAVRRWLLMSGLLSLAAGLLVAVVFWTQFRGPSLSRLTAEYHQQLSEGERAVEFTSRSDLAVEDYLRHRVSFPVRCPPRQDTGFLVRGAGICRLAESEAAYLVGQLDGQSVSIFILSREALARFPHQQEALQGEPTHRCREGNYEMVMAEIDRSIVLIVGQAHPLQLQRVLRAYGTYPHVHQS